MTIEYARQDRGVVAAIKAELGERLGEGKPADAPLESAKAALGATATPAFRQGLARMLLRLWRGYGAERPSALDALMSGWLWKPGWLTLDLPPGASRFGHGAPDLASPDQLETFRAAVDDPRDAWDVQFLFPVRSGDPNNRYGTLVRARVRALPQDRLPGGPLLIAPWSEYAPASQTPGEKTGAFSSLGRDLRPALSAAISGLTAGPGGARGIQETAFLVDLTGLHAGDLPGDVARLGDLTDPGLEIAGASLGLAVGLAAWATHERLSPANLIATGELVATGDVGEVGFVELKSEGVASFVAASDRAWWLLIPDANKNELSSTLEPVRVLPEDLEKAPRSHRGRVACVPVRSLRDVFQERFLSDGFDRYRERLGLFEPVPTDDALRRFEVTESGYSEDDEKDLARVVADLATALSTRDRATSKPRTLTVPFGEDPGIAATEVVRRLRDDWWRNEDGGIDRARHHESPVVLPISLAAFRSARDRRPSTLPKRIVEALPDWLPAEARAAVDVFAVANALRRPRKLALVLSDAPSLDVWRVVVSGPVAYRAAVYVLSSLAGDGRDRASPWEPG
ncbi:MAG: hypothetical protein AB7I30_14060, partial [Isosphaeraceae bacterium]